MFTFSVRTYDPALWPLPSLPLVTYWQAWGQFVYVCADVCKLVWVAVWLSGTLMSGLITVESLGLSLALRGSNTRSSQQQGGELQATIRYLFFHRKSRKSVWISGRKEMIAISRYRATWWKFDFDQNSTSGIHSMPQHLCTNTNPDSCV